MNTLRYFCTLFALYITIIPHHRLHATVSTVSSSEERCAELTLVAASHGLKEAWISYQPVLAVMYLVQYMPSVGFWLMDKFALNVVLETFIIDVIRLQVGAKRVETAAQKGNTYSINLLFNRKKE
ncbi:hypothetical protein HanOQP8_Chr16g0615811 [Helianthus annuus]|nr:hypothetical protein HanOQP8_Chr16g0615811 [Helianthus annuus]